MSRRLARIGAVAGATLAVALAAAPGRVLGQAALDFSGSWKITARRVVSTAFGEFVTDTKEIWSRTGDVLTIQKTQSSEGISDTETAVFERIQPSQTSRDGIFL